MEIQGKFLKASEIETAESGYQYQEFYLDISLFNQYTGEKMENILKFQIGGGRIEYLSRIQKEDRVKVFFDIKGKIYDRKDGTGKGHYQTLNAYKVEKLEEKK